MQSEQLDELAKALATARVAISHPTRNKVNPHFKNRYADLTAVLDAVVPIFALNGLTIVQMLDGPQLVTTLLHTSGQWMTTTADIPPHANAQQLGSALTYLRRYTVQSLAAIAAEDDDDGNQASPKKKNNKAESPVDGEW